MSVEQLIFELQCLEDKSRVVKITDASTGKEFILENIDGRLVLNDVWLIVSPLTL